MANILIVESDKLIADNLSAYFKKSGHHVHWQRDLQAAINDADKLNPDLVILDLMLCGRSGVEFLYEFRSYPDWQDVPVILYSGVPAGDLGDSVTVFYDLNIAAYHYKPASSLEQLANSVEQAIRVPANAETDSN